jgi:hypothetical protein
MNSNIKYLVGQVEEAQERLEQAIFNRMDVVAKQAGLTQMCFTQFGNSYNRGDASCVDVPDLDDLDDLYCEHVHGGGFEAPWSAEQGGWY